MLARARAVPARRLPRHPRGDGRPARHGAPARPAAARVPPRHRGPARARRQGRARRRRPARCLLAARALAGSQPDARHAWRAGSASSSPSSTDAGARAARGRDRSARSQGGQPEGRDHDPADRSRRPSSRLVVGWVREVAEATFDAAHEIGGVDYLGRHDDRDAAGRARGRRDRRRGRVLLVRHQRPHADDVRVLPRRHRGPVHAARTSSSTLLPHNPFETIDFEGVGELVRMAVKLGRETRPDIKLGICGEHGGDPASVRSATRSASTTCRARRTACRSPASPRRTPPSAPAVPPPPRSPVTSVWVSHPVGTVAA